MISQDTARVASVDRSSTTGRDPVRVRSDHHMTIFSYPLYVLSAAEDVLSVLLYTFNDKKTIDYIPK